MRLAGKLAVAEGLGQFLDGYLEAPVVAIDAVLLLLDIGELGIAEASDLREGLQHPNLFVHEPQPLLGVAEIHPIVSP